MDTQTQRPGNVIQLKASHKSAMVEIRRQLCQAQSLITGAKLALEESREDIATELLDIADDILADHEYIDRIDPPTEGESRAD